MLADLNNPTVTVKVKDLKKPAGLMRILKDHGIEDYSYSVRHYNPVTQTWEIIKIGMSADNATNYGDRIYRQVANLPGWPTIPRSSCGKDILPAIHDYQVTTGLTVHKDECLVEIWDVSAAPQRGLTAKKAAEDAENELLDQYENIHGKLPIGNPKDTRKITGKPFVTNTLWDDLFGGNKDSKDPE